MYITNFKPDEFGRRSKEPYLIPRESTNILNSMLIDESSRITVAKLFIESLKIKGNQIILTAFHLDWAMECIGYAFSMPILELSTIKQALKFYTDWLTLPDSIPNIMKSNFEYYQKEILGHFSLIFYKRDDLIKQAELCNEILILIQKTVRTYKFEKIGWEYLIHLITLISDYLFIYSPSLADSLSNNFLKLLFEVLLKSKTTNEELWMKAKKCLRGWNKNESVVSHWASASCGLTKAVICLLYVQSYEDLEIVFDNNLKSPDPVMFSFTDDEKVYIWYKLTDFLLDYTCSKVLEPGIQTNLAHSVHTIINNFLSLCEQREKSSLKKLIKREKNPESDKMRKVFETIENAHKNYANLQGRLPNPSINGILEIYGKWIFSHASVDSVFYHLAKSELLALLCRIFSVAQGPAKPEYLSSFFRVLLDNLKQSDKVIIGEILKSSTDLVLYGFESLQLFLHPQSFIQHLNTYLCDKETEFSVKSACYLILSTISPVCNRFQSKEYNKNIVDIFSQALGMETDNENFSLLIWSMCIFAGTITDDQDSLQSIICIMIGRIESLDYKNKDKLKFFELANVISILPYIISKKLITNQVYLQSVSNLLAFLPKRSKGPEIQRTTALLSCIINWLDCFPKAFYDSEIKEEFFSKVFDNIKYIDKEFIGFISSFILNNLARSYNKQTGLNLSSLCEQSISNMQRKHFIVANSIISAFQTESETGFVIRNPCGQYSWKLKMVLCKPKKLISFKIPILKSAPQLSSQPEKGKNSVSDQLFADLDPDLKKTFQTFSKKFDFQQSVHSPRKSNYSTKPIIYNKKTDCTFHRTFLGQTGLLETSEHVTPLTHEQFSKILTVIDSINEKELITYPLIYLESPEDTESKILTNKVFSSVFSSFVLSLGSVLSKDKLVFKHFSHIVNKYKRVIYKNFELFEALIVVPGIAELNQKIENFAKLIEKFRVLVLWNQRFNDFYSKKTPALLENIDLSKHFVIMLSPISDQVTRVEFFENTHKTGPLSNLIVVPNEALGKMLNFTVYNYLTSQNTRVNIWNHKFSMVNNERVNESTLDQILTKLFN